MIPPNADLLVWNFVIATADTSTKRRNFGGKVPIGADFGGKIQILCRRPLAIQGGFNDRQRRTLAKTSLNGIYVTHSVPKIELTLPKDVKPRFRTRLVANDVNEKQQFDLWASGFEKVGTLIRDPDRRLNDCWIEGYWAAGIGFVKGNGPGFSTIRQAQHVSQTPDQTFSLVRYGNDTQFTFPGDVRYKHRRGDFMLIETQSTHRTDFIAPGRHPYTLVTIQRSLVNAHLDKPLDYRRGPKIWGRADKINALLSIGISQFAAHAAGWDESQVERMANALSCLVATALNPTRDMLDVHRPQIDQVRLALAQEIIEMELHRPELNSATIARLSGMSIRTLERVFEPINGMARYIQERRLNLIQKAIASGEKANFDALATAHGFADRTYFSKVFKRQFGMSPHDFRALVT